MQNLEIYGFHCTLKMFSHVSLHFKIMKVRTYPFAINRCSFCKQLLQLKSLTPSICLSSSAVMGGGSQEQFITSFTWSQAATFFIPNSYFDSLAWFCLNYSQKFLCHQRYWRTTSCSPWCTQIQVIALLRSVSSIKYLFAELFILCYYSSDCK